MRPGRVETQDGWDRYYDAEGVLRAVHPTGIRLDLDGQRYVDLVLAGDEEAQRADPGPLLRMVGRRYVEEQLAKESGNG